MSDPSTGGVKISIEPVFPGFEIDTAVSTPEAGVNHESAVLRTSERLFNRQTNTAWCEPKATYCRFKLVRLCCRFDPLTLY